MPSSQGGVPPHFIVIVPGYMGSKLRDKTTGELVWVDFTSIPLNPLQWGDWLNNLFASMTYPNDRLEPAGIMDEVIFVPPWAKQEHYSRLVTALQDMGYHVDPVRYSEPELDVYSFAYDWRQDNRISAQQLKAAVKGWLVHHPGAKVWIIAHSNGGLVARWYIEKEGGKEHVSRLFLIGSPWDGTPKAMYMVFNGLDTLFRRRFNLFGIPQHTRDLLRTFPSIYQLIPMQNPFLRDPNNQPIDVSDGNWLNDDKARQLLQDGRRFNEELGTTLSVETLCFFGRKTPTTTAGIVRFAATNRWSAIDWTETEAGDGTIPERSAVHPNADEQYPFTAGHGDIYIYPPVLEFLRWQLVDKYRQAETRASLVTERLTIVFNPDRDVYSPGEVINLWATVQANTESNPPISGASIRVRLLWRQALPGANQAAPPLDLPEAQLHETAETPGRYEGHLRVPSAEGYYQLWAAIRVGGEAPVSLEELIAVEALSSGPTV